MEEMIKMKDLKWYHGIVILIILLIIGTIVWFIVSSLQDDINARNLVISEEKTTHQRIVDNQIRIEQLVDRMAVDGQLDYEGLSQLRIQSRNFWMNHAEIGPTFGLITPKEPMIADLQITFPNENITVGEQHLRITGFKSTDTNGIIYRFEK
jgi:hypothetical protein